MKITPLKTTGPDDRGYTAEYFHGRLGTQLIIFRKAGTVNGRHYHKGITIAKNPEILVLLSGSCMVHWRALDSSQLQTALIDGPAVVEIPPYVWHEFVTKTDCTFIEMNSISEHAADTFYLE